MSSLLQTPIEFLKGVGPSRGELLKQELGISTFEDLLHHYPFRYIDKSTFSTVREIHVESDYVQLKGVLHSIKVQGFKGRGQRLTAIFEDKTGKLELNWFQGVSWIQTNIKPGVPYILFGKPSKYKGKLSMSHPELTAITDGMPPPTGFDPVYSSTEKLRKRYLDSKGINKLVKTLFTKIQERDIPEFLPSHILDENKLPVRYTTLKNIHLPQKKRDWQQAKYRLVFEEFFLPQLSMLKAKLQRAAATGGYVFSKIDEHFNRFFTEQLPFELTNAQKRVVKEIRNDVRSGHQMNRLLQGDVGSGKTMVALLSMLMAIDNGFQAALMAPTEILAQQHYAGLSKLLSPIGVKVALLTGSVKGEARKNIKTALSTGELDIIIGTHALIEDPVAFNKLGIVVIDEQHRFGVQQRAKLWQKSSSAKPPHVLVMTATHIPRTLAMTVYGDLDVSIIDEMPPGRKPIKTAHRKEARRLRMFGFLKEQVDQGRQVYIVYPLIQESEKLDLKNLFDGFNDVQRYFPYPNYRTSVVHGQLKPAEKEKEMQRFVKGETNIMVATTVIEVGVDVPNATVIVIEDADRFGLAQLHQLRGRVGRSHHQSYCILMTKDVISENASTRIKTLVRTNNGFEIAEVDLKLRGPGDMQGTQQSGALPFKLASLSKDQNILKRARYAAKLILKNDPDLQQNDHRNLRYYLQHHVKYGIDWSRIS